MSKFPELEALRAKLQAEKDAILAKSGPLRAEREKLLAKIRPLEAQEREIIAKYKAIEQPRLAEIDNQLGSLAKAMGSKTLSAGG